MDVCSGGVLCFGGEDWWYHNRGHVDMQLMHQFARRGTVLYVNSIVMQKPTFRRGTGGGKSLPQKVARKLRSISRGLRRTDRGFWVYSPLSLPVHHVARLRPLNLKLLQGQLSRALRRLGLERPLIWVACPAACDVALEMDRAALIYQRTDRYEEYPNVDAAAISAYDRRLKENADLTVYVNETLFEAERTQCQRSMYLDHGVDYELFASAHRIPDNPAELRHIPRPIVGFFGGIDNHTSDLGFLLEVVRRLPDLSFVFVGRASADIAALQACPNVHFLSQKPYEQIPQYGKCFDVAIMAWHRNRWIEACNPIKLKEYLALGKPVVSTPFSELRKYSDIVYAAETPETFAQAIQRALREDSADQVERRRRRVAASTWQAKADTVLLEVTQCLEVVGLKA